MRYVEARLVAQLEYQLGQPIDIGFELHNTGESDVYVLKWLTPLEGVLSDCLDVRRDGIGVSYDGPLGKRGKQSVRDYLLLSRGGKLFAEFDLSRFYSISERGTYTVTMRGGIYVLLTSSAVPLEVRVGQGEHGVLDDLTTAHTTFVVVGDGQTRLTLGQQVRLNELERSEEGVPSAESSAESNDHDPFDHPMPPTFAGGTDSQRLQVVEAYSYAFYLSKKASKELSTDPVLGPIAPAGWITWFGVFDRIRGSTVRGNFNAVVRNMRQKVFMYTISSQPKCNGLLAYTYKGSTSVWICPAFFDQDTTGVDCMGGIIVHEHGHASALLDDITYGTANCKKLAQETLQAINNADSYEYYAGG